jgi:glycosyltransferase involved in cell wall biosynthesis
VSCASPDGPFGIQLDDLGVHRVRLPELKLPGGPRPIVAALLAWRNVRAASVLRRACTDADVVLANSLLTLPALTLARPRPPVVMLAHDVIRRASWRWLLRWCRRVVTLAVAVSSSAAGPLRDVGLPVKVVRNGTPWPVDPVADDPPSRPVIGCAAVLTPWKGQDVLLEAVALLRRRDIKVELAGGRLPKDDAYAEALEERVRRPDLEGLARLLGPVADPVQRMRTWTAMVVPSVDPEAGPLAPLEAMSVGVPVIGTDLGGTTEVVGAAGLLVPPRDPGALASAIEHVVDDRALWGRCHSAGPRQIAAGLTLDAQLSSLIAVLGDVVDQRRTS